MITEQENVELQELENELKRIDERYEDCKSFCNERKEGINKTIEILKDDIKRGCCNHEINRVNDTIKLLEEISNVYSASIESGYQIWFDEGRRIYGHIKYLEWKKCDTRRNG